MRFHQYEQSSHPLNTAIFTNFEWKNKHHHLKKGTFFFGSRAESGFELLDFLDNAFKVKWIKQCLKAPNSLWHFIPHSM